MNKKSPLRITVAQLNFCVGDIAGNTKKIITAIEEARDKLNSDIVVFPELAVSDYPPGDLLLRADFQKQVHDAIITIKHKTTGITVILGHIYPTKGKIYNAASVIRNKKIVKRYYKQCLPNTGVFNEKRYFSNDVSKPCVFKEKNVNVGLIICEDIWHPMPSKQSAQAGAEIIVCINASPFDIHKLERRKNMIRARIQKNKIPILYTHRVSGQDDLIFDGGSMAMNVKKEIVAQAEFFAEQLWPVDVSTTKPIAFIPQPVPPLPSEEEFVYRALVLSVRDYVAKNNFPGVLIGLSGGIDSALTLAVAVDAIGSDRVHGVLMPSQYTSELSLKLAKEQAKTLNVKISTISIEPTVAAFTKSLATEFAGLPADQTEENIQARCRGVILMALSNKTGKLVLITGNKSEMAVGYATLYGDMAGGYAPLKDVYKTMVYKLAAYRNAIAPVIPTEVITRAPSAELAPNQKDQDSLPPYDVLDEILKLYIEHDNSLSDLVAAGFNKKTAQRVIDMVTRNEYKRRQAPPGPRVTPRAFARERMYPITSKFKTT